MGTFSMEDLENLEGSGADNLENLDLSGDVDGDEDFDQGTDAGAEPAPQAQGSQPERQADGTYRYGDDAPEELRGKTPEEALAAYNNLRQFARVLYAQQTGQGGAPAQNAPAQAPPEITENELLTSDAPSINQKLQSLFETKATPFINDTYQKLSLVALSEAERNEQAMPYFKKYRAEIIEQAQQLSAIQTSDIRTWKALHDQVAAKHMQEIIAEQVAAARAAREQDNDDPAPTPTGRPGARGQGNLPFSERGTRAGGKQGGAAPVKLTPEQQSIARGLGVSYEEFAKLVPMFSE